MSYKGSCLCGAVRYQSSAEPIYSGHCYCNDCRKETGGGHTTLVAVPTPTVTVSGDTKVFVKPGDSGQPTERTFCPSCGSTVYSRVQIMPGVTMFRAGTLDEASTVVPGMCIYTSRAQAWDPPKPELPGFPAMPQRS